MANPLPSSRTHAKFNFWTTPNNYALALICWSNTFGNSRKFPLLFEKYGHIQVLLPYAVVTVFLIIPFLFTELAIGQYSNNGFVNMWRMVPIMRGLIWPMVTITFFTIHYGLFATAHAGYYLFKSFETSLPWTRCDPSWATEVCVNALDPPEGQNLTGAQSSVEHFYRELVLSENAITFSELNVRLFFYITITLTIIGVCLVNRITTIEKLQVCLVVVPFILLVALTITSFLQQTSLSDLSTIIQPNVELLLDYHMWVDVVNNALTNIGLSMGGIVCIAAHGNFRSNIYAFAVLTPLYNLLFDMIFTLFVYSIWTTAVEAGRRNPTFEALFNKESSLLFVQIPTVLLELPTHRQLWTIAYFLYLYITGLRYALFLLFTLTSALHETFHCVYHLRRYSIAVLSCITMFVMPLYVSPVGNVLFEEMEDFCSSTFITFLALLEAIAIYYIYGARKLLTDVQFMLNKRQNYLHYLLYAIPVVLCAVAISNFHDWSWTRRVYRTFWIFIIQCVVMCLMIVLVVSHFITYMVANWEKNYRQLLQPAKNWGCSNEDMRRNREFFKSDSPPAQYAYQQEMYERTISALN